MNIFIRFALLPVYLYALLACNDGSGQLAESEIQEPDIKASRNDAAVASLLTQFIDASINRRHEDYYDLLSAKDKSIKTKDDYLEQQNSLQPNLADHYFHRITYKITSMTVDKGEAKVEVLYQFPDVERMIKQVYNLAVLGEKQLPALDEMKQRLDLEFQDKPLPMKSKTRQFTLLKEDGEWRVYVGWDKQKQ